MYKPLPLDIQSSDFKPNQNQPQAFYMDLQTRKVKFTCNHPLKKLNLDCAEERIGYYHRHNCDGCGDLYTDPPRYSNSKGFYCSICKFGAHTRCIDFPDIINHPCHSRHPLKMVHAKTVDYTDGKCHFCRRRLRDWIYHCSICNFSLDLACSFGPPPLTIHQPKSHNHTFTLMPTKVSFTCNACAMAGDRNPYVCLECGFILHKDCIDLPRVISINRHDHRVSRTYHLGHGEWETCGVCRCRKEMDWSFGAFSCKFCPSYAVHAKCAIRKDVWDGKEMEDEPEEEEDEDPYKVINEKEILHFCHEHNLRVGDNNNGTDCEKMWCNACSILIISSDLFFKCMQCEFFIHKTCASFPRKKRNILHQHKLTLHAPSVEECNYCHQLFDGFSYSCESCNFHLDVRCASITEPFHHELHPHPLYRTSIESKTCGACCKVSKYVLSCIVCEFALGMECATLPRKVKHRCDDHVLTLHHGAGNSNGQLWCDICEEKTDPSVWYYGCDDCGVTLHIKCVVGDMYYLKLGKDYNIGDLVHNNGMTRPPCVACEYRCMFPSFLKGTNISDSTVVVNYCSMKCAFEA